MEEIAEIRVVETFKFYRARQRTCKYSRASDPLIGIVSKSRIPMVARLGGVLLLVLLCTRGVPAIDSGAPPPERPPIPPLVGGVELETVHGWFANIYPWKYLPDLSTVYPVRALWARPNDYQSPADIARQNALLEEYGSGADVLEYSANPDLPDHNHWLRTYFTNGDRPFFVAYEHVYGTRLLPDNGAKNMNVRYNRIAFRNDIDAIYRNVVVPFGRRYVTYHGRAVIYLWAASAMYGDFASLLDELRAEYPVAFIGSVGLMQLPTDAAALRNFSALDGFMEYGLYDARGYDMMTAIYAQNSGQWRRIIRTFQAATGRKYVFIPTFQAAFDNSKFSEGVPPMYPVDRAAIVHHAENIKQELGTAYDPLGPFVVFSELIEGAAVIESQCISDTLDKRDRWVGCGTGRLEILRQFFAPTD